MVQYFKSLGLALLLSVIFVTFSVTQSNSQEVSTTFVAFERLINKWGGGRIYIGCGDDKFFKFKVEKNITGKFSLYHSRRGDWIKSKDAKFIGNRVEFELKKKNDLKINDLGLRDMVEFYNTTNKFHRLKAEKIYSPLEISKWGTVGAGDRAASFDKKIKIKNKVNSKSVLDLGSGMNFQVYEPQKINIRYEVIGIGEFIAKKSYSLGSSYFLECELIEL